MSSIALSAGLSFKYAFIIIFIIIIIIIIINKHMRVHTAALVQAYLSSPLRYLSLVIA